MRIHSIENLRNAFRWHDLKTLFVAIFIIALFLSVIFASINPETWHIQIIATFSFTFFIGCSLYLILNIIHLDDIQSRLIRFFATVMLILIAGWAGNFFALAFLKIIFNLEMTLNNAFIVRHSILILFFGATTYGYFLLKERLNFSIKSLAEKEVNEQRILQLKVKAELNALRAKVNPHFLFNTLNTIASLIPVDPVKAENMVQKLSQLFRYSLNAENREWIKLADELDIIQAYLEIEKVRLGERLSFTISTDESLAEILIPCMILQPLVENSIKHGIAPLKSHGEIKIICKRINHFCQIEIKDNGKGFNPEKHNKGFGLRGVEERLRLYYGEKYQFHITNENGAYTIIRIPISG